MAKGDKDMMFIDDNILPLVQAMNETGWIRTVSSCQGHDDKGKEFESPHVAFFVKSDCINELAKVLDRAEKETIDEVDAFIRCKLVFSEEIANSQADAPDGWIAFCLDFEPLFERFTEEKRIEAIKILTEEFEKNNRGG